MANLTEEFIEHRAETLAFIVLTRRDDIRVQRNPRIDGLDLLINVDRPGGPSAEIVGVVVKGVSSQEKISSTSAGYEISIENGQLDWRDFVFPACLMVFSMDDDQGYVRWITEPIPGEAAPVYRENAHFEELTDDWVAGMVHQVRDWYATRRNGKR